MLKKFCLLWFLLGAMTLWANVELSTPKDKSTVEVLTPKQKAFFDLSVADRRVKSLDTYGFRVPWLQTGFRTLPVRFTWSGIPQGTEVHLFLTEGEQTTEMTSLKSSLELRNLKVGVPYRWYITAMVNGQMVRSPEWTFTVDDTYFRLLWFDNFQTKNKSDTFTNVRDLGNKKALAGKRVRQGLLYRGFAFNYPSPDREKTPGKMRISPKGLQEIAKLGIKTDLDLRSRHETAGMTASPLGEKVQWKRMDSTSYTILKPGAKKCFAALFRVFTDPANYPVYFHCDGGRDRTGTLAFLLLGALGVDDATIETDWQTSFLAFTGLEQKSFDGMIAALRKKYGDKSMSELALAYLADIGITPKEIDDFRAIMLEQ